MKSLKSKDYIAIARPDHWFKNVFMMPGIVFALYDSPHLLSINLVLTVLLGTFATCIIASSNYTLNEILDAPMDALHPVKKFRPVPSGKINIKIAYIQWFFFGCRGIMHRDIYQQMFFFQSSFSMDNGNLLQCASHSHKGQTLS
jgi:4-hydroxybenzoate polyprenyltransferase